MTVADDGLRHRSIPATASSSSSVASAPLATAPPEHESDDIDMAYGSVRNRPAIATSVRRTISSGLYSSNNVLRRYYNRILIVFAVTAVYTLFIYKSGASFACGRRRDWPYLHTPRITL
jgi:hypothetical protein